MDLIFLYPSPVVWPLIPVNMQSIDAIENEKTGKNLYFEQYLSVNFVLIESIK